MAKITKRQLKQLQLGQRIRFSYRDEETGRSVELEGTIRRLGKEQFDPWDPGSPYFQVETDSADCLLVADYEILGSTTPLDEALQAQRAAVEKAQRAEMRALPREFDRLAKMLASQWYQWSTTDTDEPLVAVLGTSFLGTKSVSVKRLNGAYAGSYRDYAEVVTLCDERLRDRATRALVDLGVAVGGTSSLRPFADATLVPGAHGKWKIVGVCPGHSQREAPLIAEYYETIGLLDLGHPAFAEQASNLVRRHGMDVKSQCCDLYEREKPKEPADLNPLRRAVGEPVWIAPLAVPAVVSDEVRQLVEFHATTVASVLDSAPRMWPRRPQDEAEAGAARCGLCTELFHVDDLSEPHRTFAGGEDCCPRCVASGLDGVLVDQGITATWEHDAIWAIQRMTEEEFGGPPSLNQLRAPLEGDRAARLRALALRILTPREPDVMMSAMRPNRPLRSWIDWLEAAEVLTDGYRAGRGTWTRATDGHRCRSLFERHVDDFMSLHGIAHEVEPAYPLDQELNATGLRADWKLADGTFVEALGLANNPQYDAKWRRKQELAHMHGIRLVGLFPDDLVRLRQLLDDWIRPTA